MQYVKAPDFPTGGYIYGISGVRDAYETGRGRVVMRAKAEIETHTSHDKIIVNEIPYNVNKKELIESSGNARFFHQLFSISICHFQ